MNIGHKVAVYFKCFHLYSNCVYHSGYVCAFSKLNAHLIWFFWCSFLAPFTPQTPLKSRVFSGKISDLPLQLVAWWRAAARRPFLRSPSRGFSRRLNFFPCALCSLTLPRADTLAAWHTSGRTMHSNTSHGCFRYWNDWSLQTAPDKKFSFPIPLIY